MAERRMFTKKITDSDEFISLSSSAQALYFHLNMGADDDGFNNQIQNAMFKAHSTADDFNILIAKKFIVRFESGVIVIRHWKMHNYIRQDTYSETRYLAEKERLQIGDDKSYTIRPRAVHEPSTQVRLGKDSIDKDSIGEDRIVKDRLREGKPVKTKFGDYVSMTKEEHQKLINEFGEENTKEIIEILNNYKGANGKTYKSDYLAILNWVVKRWKDEHRESKSVAKSFKQQEHDDFMAYVEEMAQKGKYVP